MPIWLLGSSLYSAQLAAAMGLPFGFASHFARPAVAGTRDSQNRTQFPPFRALAQAYAVVCINVIAADNKPGRPASHHAQQQFLRLYRGDAGKTAAAGAEPGESGRPAN